MNDPLHPIFREALAPFAPLDADNIKVGHALRESANDGELTAADLAAIDADATTRAMDCLKRGFRDSLSPFSEEEAQRIDAAMLADKQRNTYDRRREEQAAQVEADQRRARGEA